VKITFAYSGFENLGIEYISSVLKGAGHSTELVLDPKLFDDITISNRALRSIFNDSKRSIDEIIDSKPDIVAFSVLSDEYRWACDTAAEVKKRMNVPIVFGGIHPTAVPEEVIERDFVDFVVVGEGEYAMLELVEALENGEPVHNIKNVWSKKNGTIIKNDVRPPVQDLDSLPLPDKDLFFRKYPYCNTFYRIMGSRGCVLSCSFCGNSYLSKLYKDKGQLYRKRSPHNIIEELSLAKQKFPLTSVEFWDGVFTFDKEWLRELLSLYKQRINLPFCCCIHPAMVDEETVQLLSESGCREVEIGVETIDPRARKDILHRYETNEQILNALNIINKHNILCPVDMIVGLPGHGIDDHVEILRFFNEHRVDFIYFCWLRYHPKTEINRYKYLHKKEDINEEEQKAFFLGGINRNKELFKIQNFAVLMFFLPKRITSFLIKIKFYKILPSKISPFFSVYLSICRVQLENRKKKSLHFGEEFKNRYKYFMKRKCKERLIEIFKGGK